MSEFWRGFHGFFDQVEFGQGCAQALTAIVVMGSIGALLLWLGNRGDKL